LVVALFIVSTVRSTLAQPGTNTSLGTGALPSSTTGSSDAALGFFALSTNTSGSDDTATGAGALFSNTTGSENTATGDGALFDNRTGIDNTASGLAALQHNISGNNNTATGFFALFNNTTGDGNTSYGVNSLQTNITGAGNTADGINALSNNNGNHNIAVGFNAGHNLTSGDNNIDIGNLGVADEANVIRIGTQGTQNRTVIAGINNAAIFGSPVVVNAFGRLGIQASSARYKHDIRDMGEASERLMKLRPVTFRYKQDPNGAVQYGLVAEEVAQVYPELVTYGDDGKPFSVAYQTLPAMLLNEVQKQVRENRRKDAQIAELRKQVESLQKETAQIDMLSARLSALEQQARTSRPVSTTAMR
jgi:hypothetical protein